jgi:integrase/recombinase XerD
MAQFGERKSHIMNIIISAKKSRSAQKTWYYLEWGKAAGQRVAAGIFTYTKPKDQIQKNHNKEALLVLETKSSQLILEQQAISSRYIPKHKFQSNFLDYYAAFVENNKTQG